MSSWRIVTRALYELGKPAPLAQIEMQAHGVAGAGDALKAAARHGLVKAPGRSGAPHDRMWELTSKGIAWCEGRVRDQHGPKRTGVPGAGSLRFWPTWLAALPRGVRIEPGPLQLAAAA